MRKINHYKTDVYKRQVLRPAPFLESLSQACWFMNAKSSATFLVQYVWVVN